MQKTHTILFKTMLLVLRDGVLGVDMRIVGTKCTTQVYAALDMNMYSNSVSKKDYLSIQYVASSCSHVINLFI